MNNSITELVWVSCTCSLKVEGHHVTANNPQRVRVIVGRFHTLAFGVDTSQSLAVVLQELCGAALSWRLVLRKGADLCVVVRVWRGREKCDMGQNGAAGVTRPTGPTAPSATLWLGLIHSNLNNNNYNFMNPLGENIEIKQCKYSKPVCNHLSLHLELALCL